MVLQSAVSRQAIKRRILHNSNSENTPPKQRRVSTSIREASRRRRARVVSGKHTLITHKSRYAYDVKHRKAKATSGARLRFQFATQKLPPPSFIHDVEMKDAESLHVHVTGTATNIQKTTVTLPRHLPRPEYKDINKGVLAAIEPEFEDTPIEYIHDGLEAMGPDMYKVLTGIVPQPLTNTLPKELAIVVNDLSSDMPSHMLAIYAQSSSRVPSTHRNKVTLFPSHNVILAAHCANLPALPSATHPIPAAAGSSITVPVVPLCIPAPELYTPLSVYLYTKRLDILLQSLLPALPTTSLNVYTSPDETSEEATKQREGLLSFAQRLAATYTPHALLSYAMRVNGLWRNVCALGIFESKIWAAMDFAWEVLILAMAIATGDVNQVIEEPAAVRSVKVEQ